MRVLLLATLLIVPVASAAWPWEPLSITTAPSRIGERASWEIVTSDRTGARTQTLVTLIESTSRMSDRFGVARDVETMRIDRYEGGEWASAERCHGLRGGPDAVRRDLLHGEISWTSDVHPLGRLGVEGTVQLSERTVASLSPARCEPRNLLGAARLTERDEVALGAIARDAFDADPEDMFGSVVSQPAVATRWQGRRALSFTFDLRDSVGAFSPPGAAAADVEGALTLVVADGFPGYVWAEARFTEWDETGAPSVVTIARRLAGFERAPATAPAVAAWTGVRVPEAWPAERLRPADRLVLDDEAFGLSFRYHEAWASALQDPTTGMAAFLAAHPDAHLRQAIYERGARDPTAAMLPSDGSWLMVVCAQTECQGVRSFRVALSQTPPVKTIRHHAEAGLPEPSFIPPDAPFLAIDSRTAESVLRGAGYPFGEWGNLLYAAGYGPSWSGERSWAAIIITDTADKDPSRGDQEGLGAWLHLTEGGIGSVFERNVRQGAGLASGALPIAAPPPVEGTNARAATPLAMPASLPLVLSAAVGLSAAALVAKAIWALYSRLQTSDALTHPVRARLYARIRSEPGLHRAPLIVEAATGNGAARYHLATLVRHKLVYTTSDGGYVRYFPVGDVSPEEARREAVLRAGRHRDVYALYATEPDLPLREAARRLGMSAPGVYRAKRKLAHAGLLPVRVDARIVEA